MNKEQFYHLAGAVSSISNTGKVYFFEENSLLSSDYSSINICSTDSLEVFLPENHGLTCLLEQTLGELSVFKKHFGYFVKPLQFVPCFLPCDWEERLVEVSLNTVFTKFYRLDIYDLAASKLMAFREKDLDFIKALIKHDIIEPSKLTERINEIDGFDEKKVAAIQFLNG